MITKNDILDLFKKLKIVGKEVVVHSSFKSIGPVEGGPMTVVNALTETFPLVMVPSTSYRSVTKCPDNDRPANNGCNYSFYDNWDKESLPFSLELNSIDKKMGVIAKIITELSDTSRSATPWHSWSVYGKDSKEIAQNTDWNNTDKPLRKIIARDGLCVMIGVDLSTCSAIHIAEEQVGRNHFIRWCTDSEGNTKRVEAQGCGEGFNKLQPYVDHLITKETLGNATVMVFKLQDIIKEATMLMKKNPDITKCSDTCIRCRDTALGGPKDVAGEKNER